MRLLADSSYHVKQIVLIFVVAVALNYVWEIAQAPLYVGLDNWSSLWWHCFVAALGDGVLIWVILVVGWVVFSRFDWYVLPSSRTLTLILVSGLLMGIGVEWVAVNNLGRWTYTANMPLLPGLNAGLVPVLQMVLLPPLIFRIAGRWSEKNGNEYR